jgi:hypothetical protein
MLHVMGPQVAVFETACLVDSHRRAREDGAAQLLDPLPPLHTATLLQFVDHSVVGQRRRVVHVPSDGIAAHPDRHKNLLLLLLLLLLESYLLA